MRGHSRIACIALLVLVAASVAVGSGLRPGMAAVGAQADAQDCGTEPLSSEQLVALGFEYPYRREPTSYLFVNGVAYPYVRLGPRSLMDASVRAGTSTLPARVLLERLGLGDEIDRPRTPVLAYGANANVDALTRKYVTSGFSSPAVIPVVEGTLTGYDVTWAPHLVFNGAMPATIVASPGTTVSVWVTWLDAAELEQMHQTEGVGSMYSYGRLRQVPLEVAGPPVAEPGVYVDCFGALRIDGQVLAVDAVPAEHRRLRAVTSAGALARAAKALGWRGSVFDLLLEQVRSPELRASRTEALRTLAVQRPLPRYEASIGCPAEPPP